MFHGPKTTRHRLGPLGADFARPRGPEPRLLGKDVNNPPIVTIFGAGIAGLTAAHELVDRGFLVQVIEAKRDAYARGRPLVGGMAATQYARVRANVEDLHPALLSPELSRTKVGQWLLRLLGFNRSWWLQTERPGEIHSALYAEPAAPSRSGGTIGERVVECLQAAKRRYRDSWIWDLVVRSVLIDTVRQEAALNPSFRARQRESQLMDLAWHVYETLHAKPSAYSLAHQILEYELKTVRAAAEAPQPPPAANGAAQTLSLPELPSEDDFDAARNLIETTVEREFLCFRLLPHSIEDDPAAVHRARELLDQWQRYLRSTHLRRNLWAIDEPENARVQRAKQPRRQDGGPPPTAWLEIDIVEQRLPGEHGFRFFPSFYRHLDDTLQRIPLLDCCERESDRTVYDNLRSTTVQAIGLSEEDRRQHVPSHARRAAMTADEQEAVDGTIEIKRSRPTSFEGLRDRTDRFLARLGCTPKDGILFSLRMLRFMTSCPERRQGEYEHMSWAQFTGVDVHAELEPLPYSRQMKAQIEAAAQCVLALSAAEADARTYGDATVQLYQDMLGDGTRTDRTLNGPSSDAFLEPWREHLERQGVRFFLGRLERLGLEGGELVPHIVLQRDRSQSGHELLVHDAAAPGRSPDFYVLALDFKAAHELIVDLPHDEQRAPELAALRNFRARAVARGAMKDMSGVQFFFDSKASIGRGHIYYPYSEWGLSSISQSEFWSKRGGFSDGYLGVLSVDVSRMTPGDGAQDFLRTLQRGARAVGQDLDDRLGRWWAAREVWGQIAPRIGVGDSLPEPRVFHVDENIALGPFGELANGMPYLVSLPGMFHHRPGHKDGKIEYQLSYDRWALCGTFMATHTRMTSMESANESARHAVKAILQAMFSGESAEPRGLLVDGVNVWVDIGATKKYNGASRRRRFDDPDTWNLEDEEPDDLATFKRLDQQLHQAGLPHFMDICDLDRRIRLAVELAEVDTDQAGIDGAKRLLELALRGVEASIQQATGPGHPLHPHAARVTTLVRWFAGLGAAPQ